MSQILTTAIEKGGTGKTTTVVNLAALMAAEGKRVLVVIWTSRPTLPTC